MDKRRKYTNTPKQVLQAHAHRHRVNLIAYEGVTSQNISVAKVAVCIAAHEIAQQYSLGDLFTNFTGDPDSGMMVFVGSRHNQAPRRCPLCDADRSHLPLEPIIEGDSEV